MKKVLLTVAILASGFFVQAQKNVIKANPLGLLFGSAQFGYERAIGSKQSLELSAAFSSVKVTVGGSESKNLGYGAEAKYKLYFSSSKQAPRGWYGSPFVSFSSTKYDLANEKKASATTYGGGLLAGYQWVFGGGNSGFSLDLNFGAGYYSVNSDEGVSLNLKGLLPRVGLALGYAW